MCSAVYRTDFDRCPSDGGALAINATDPLVGSVLAGQYEIDGLIGEGAMGRVYRAHHTRLTSKRYAIKVLLGDFAASAAMRMRFANEAETVSKLEHPNIVGVLDFGRTPSGLMYIVMELIDGPSLSKLCRPDPLAPRRAITLARQLCRGLAHAHARGLVHRDFKPDNILVAMSDDGEVARIVDFGLAISLYGEDVRLTQSGTLWCTPAYAAPEQTSPQVDHRADLYALGVTMYEMLSGKLPFEGEPQSVMARKAIEDPPRLPTSVPAGLAAIVMRLMGREPAARFAYADDVITALDALGETRTRRRSDTELDQSTETAFAPTAMLTTGQSPITRRARWPWVLGGLAIAAAAAAGVAWWQLRGVDQPAPVVAAAPPPPAPVAPAPPAPPPAVIPDPPPAPVVISDPPPVPVVAPDPPHPVAPASRAHHATGHHHAAAPAPAAAEPVVERAPDPPHPIDPPPIAPAPVEPPPAPVTPPPAPVTPPTPAPAKPAELAITELSVDGPLPASVVRRAVDRVMARLRACSGQVGAHAITARFSIGASRRVGELQIAGAGSSCVSSALGELRTEVAPDVGDTEVKLVLSYGGAGS